HRGGGRPVTSPASLYVDVAGRPWVKRWPGVHWKVLWEEGDRKVVLMRYDPGAVIPRHRHLGDEHIFVLEGAVADDTGACTAGNYARRPPGCVHTVRSEGGALVLAVMSGGTEGA
ncbi:MAG TPA: cupin domain-containing protein, partial [Candidatus Methylomirabilis sp.]|nr:cupin domain-containing protein [Candidatus Methylomirabilis sp.]